MKSEHSYGVIPLRLSHGEWWVYLVQHQAGHWNFPKGHPEPNETPQETAQRELYEETGFTIVAFLPFPKIEESYTFQREGARVDKQVTYFLAEVSGEEKYQAEELIQGRWVPLQEAHQLITFEEGRKVCRQVQQYVR
jgi:bis(5'-nucleosidyl)-tetraphosphatase